MMREGIAIAVPYRAATLLSVLSLAASAGCTDPRPTHLDDADTGGRDSGFPAPGNFGDGRSSDAPIFGDDDVRAGIASETPPGGWDHSGCFATDDTGEGNFDCNAEACAALRSCRIGSGQLCSRGIPTDIFADGCEGAPLTPLCLGDLGDIFGSPSPWVAGGGIHPGGTDFDSGFYLNREESLRSQRMKLDATFATPACAGAVTCLENVAFGVTARAEFDSTTRVRAAAALELQAARNEVALLLEDVTVFRWPYDPTKADWALELTPDGRAHVWNDGTLLDTFDYTPRDGLRVAVYGRNVNHGFPDASGARLTRLTATIAACDIPDAWTERGEAALTLHSGGSAYDPRRPSGASVATGPESSLDIDGVPRRWVAFHEPNAEGGSQIFAAFESSAGLDELRLAHEVTSPILEPHQGHDAVSVRDPELVYDSDAARWHIYYTAEDAAGTLSIGHAEGTQLTELTADDVPLINAEDWDGLAKVEMPTVALIPDGRRLLAVRATMTDGSRRLVGFIEDLVVGDFVRITGELGAMTARGDGFEATGFDADEISQPSLVIWDGAVHLYYAGRRGTRWGIGLLATDDFLTFRDVTPTAPILSGSAVGFDTLGARGIDVEIVDGFAVALYEGTDGFETGIGYARRSVPAGEAP